MYSFRRLFCILLSILLHAGLTQILPRQLSMRQYAMSEWYTSFGGLAKGDFRARSLASEDAKIGPWGFNLTGQDLSVKPGDDFYAYAVGNYLKSFEIPPDESKYGTFHALAAKADDEVKRIIESDTGKIGDYYKAYTDREKIESLGIQPLTHLLKEIERADHHESLARLAGKAVENFFFSPFELYIHQDDRNPDVNVVHITQGGLGLPSRDYYLEDQHKHKKHLYQKFIRETLHRLQYHNPRRFAEEIVQFETKIAKASWSLKELRDRVKAYNSMSLHKLKEEAPGFDWSSFLSAAGVHLNSGNIFRHEHSRNIVVEGLSAIVDISKAWATAAQTHEGKLMLKAWQAFHVTYATSRVLPKRYVDAAFEFSKHLSGAQELEPLWKRAVKATSRALGEEVGKKYVAKHFPEDSKHKMDALVHDLLATHKANIHELKWMTHETKKKALKKLKHFTVKIGHPNKFTDYSDLIVTPDDMFGNYLRVAKFHWQEELKELGKLIDKDKWHMTPQTVNAYYSPTMNEIVFPAAILQPPLFDPAADAAVNYGAIGAVIGHEITHGFDDMGRHYDETGKLENWWTSEDELRFKALTERLGKQYSNFQTLGGSIDAELTMGENIADNGGLRMALEAYHRAVGVGVFHQKDGLSGDQRFFLSWAQVWASKTRPERAEQDLKIDVHSPASARGTLPQCNMDPWYHAFRIHPGDKNYLEPKDRVEIWYAGPDAPPLQPWPSHTPGAPSHDPRHSSAPGNLPASANEGSLHRLFMYVCGAVVALFVMVCVARSRYCRCFKRKPIERTLAPAMEFTEPLQQFSSAKPERY